MNSATGKYLNAYCVKKVSILKDFSLTLFYFIVLYYSFGIELEIEIREFGTSPMLNIAPPYHSPLLILAPRILALLSLQ